MKHATAALVFTSSGIPLVKDPKKPFPQYWKLPGGRGNEQRAVDCVIREVREETGLDLRDSFIKEIYEEKKGNHTVTIFCATLIPPTKFNNIGDEGEIVQFFSREEVKNLCDFFPNHKRAVQNYL